MLESNYLIINRKPQRFSTLRAAGKTAVFLDAAGRPLDFGAVRLDDNVYTALCCEEVWNITLVTDSLGNRNVVTILWDSEEGYREGYAVISRILGRHIYVQNKRINRYAEAIAEKLEHGIRLRVTDAVEESGMAVCPECGTMNPPGSEYCLECGAEIS